MAGFRNPKWLTKFQFSVERFEDITEETFTQVNAKLDSLSHPDPVVSIVVIAWNEETNILRCISSLAETISAYPLEIIVVNNNSTDKTQHTIDQLHVRAFIELKQGAGPARQKGQVHAKGKYILTADADCIYPPYWVDEMVHVLKQPKVVCVYGRYSFIGEGGFPRWQLLVLEKLKDIMAEIRHFRQPYFNCFGISMGYIKEYGLNIGFIQENRRGEDGQLCLDLMKYGKIKQVRSAKARVWTDIRTLQKEGNFVNVIYNRFMADIKRFKYNFIHRKLS
ncbi:glycosyltransferase family 2 protein [Parapedobacter koreensis]|uniref:Glycosyltransferase involved in cell wall bisynthesis n=1 Tax=Parapedobacter koreensis TaxID=332977 RepID=A0A1H7IK99_9SPHI|nr:glycosyltransferase family 2 protein [Parapedobacter koreensis]SEK62157.1 Glycosyltransferase involved in cell wall bisynthesis [Parapedobacter koreensis]